jgi:hypothetical protein
MGSVILYETKRRIWLTLQGEQFFSTRNMAMHNPDFLAFKDSQTDIEFIIRNTDRKPIDITDRKLFATFTDIESKKTLASIPLTIVDASRGIAKLTLLPHMVKDIRIGFHRYTISYMSDLGYAKLLNTDQYESSHGFFEIRYGRELRGVVSQEAAFEEFTPVTSNQYETYWNSPLFSGNLRGGSLDGLHTFTWYFDNFSGSIWVEGSISEAYPEEDDWFPILIDNSIELIFENETGIIAHNLQMNLQWVRFKVLPDYTATTGKLVKVLFRN